MTAAVTMLTDALPELLYFGNQLFTRHLIKVGVHTVVPASIQGVQWLVSSRQDGRAAQRGS